MRSCRISFILTQGAGVAICITINNCAGLCAYVGSCGSDALEFLLACVSDPSCQLAERRGLHAHDVFMEQGQRIERTNLDLIVAAFANNLCSLCGSCVFDAAEFLVWLA